MQAVGLIGRGHSTEATEGGVNAISHSNQRLQQVVPPISSSPPPSSSVADGVLISDTACCSLWLEQNLHVLLKSSEAESYFLCFYPDLESCVKALSLNV